MPAMWKQKSAYEQIQNTFFAASRKAWKRKDTNKFWLTWIFQGQNQRRLQVKLSAVMPPFQMEMDTAQKHTVHPSPNPSPASNCTISGRLSPSILNLPRLLLFRVGRGLNLATTTER